MAVKHHCIICGYLIYSGMYCSGCSREIVRTRTVDDESLEDWIRKMRFNLSRTTHPLTDNVSLYSF